MVILLPFFSRTLSEQGSAPYLVFRTRGDSTVQRLLYEMYYECNHPIQYTRHMLNNKMSELFIYLLRYHQNHLISEKAGPQCADAVLPMLQYIQTNYANVTLSDLSRLYHYKESYISRILKRETGRTFSEIKDALRMEQGRALLESTDRSIHEIALELGFSDQSHFTRHFRQVYGIPPKQYRESHTYTET